MELAVRGSGDVEVVFERLGRQRRWQSHYSDDEVLALLRLLVDHEVWAIEGQRETGASDEAYPLVTIEAQGFEPLQVGMWQAEAREHPDFGAIVTTLDGLAREISGGVAH
jgi:hypothetical protein